MATVNLGRIKPVNKGTWSSATTYAVDDFVQYTDSGVLSTYIAVASGSNQVPSTSGTENSSKWKYMSKGTSLAVGNNKVLISDGSGNVTGQTIGSAGEVLKVNSGANGFEFGSGAKVRQVVQGFNSTRASLGTTNARLVYWNATSFTKQLADSKLHVQVQIPLGGAGDTYPGFGIDFIRFSTSGYSADAGADIFGYLNNTRATSNDMGAFVIGNFLYDTTGTNIAAAGGVYVSIGYDSYNSSTWRPAPIWNPNVSEDPRGRQSFSTIVITEIE